MLSFETCFEKNLPSSLLVKCTLPFSIHLYIINPKLVISFPIKVFSDVSILIQPTQSIVDTKLP